ncbi:hypothetical protein F5Y15DRAFT_363215 [Xylariaceae sp. FL0016]|nr:hypothetical protein F5Y15DRAFT_363215 [Xylariaceae sp. FL0016]
MDATMASTATATSASATATSTCGVYLYDIPITDAACAVPFGGNNTDTMSSCCKDADVVSYYSDCGLYCLAEDQTIEDLQKCLMNNGVAPQSVFCNAANNATATATDATPAASASASVVAGGSSDSDNGDSTSSGSDPTSTNAEGAAPRLAPNFGISTLSLTIGTLLFSATAFGAFQL